MFIIERSKRGQIAALFFIEISISAAFAVFFSGLFLFLNLKLSFSTHAAVILTSLFLSIHYTLPLIGGMLANRFITYKNMYLLGTAASLIGYVCLATRGDIFISLAFVLMGSLVTNVCLNMFVTNLFKPEEISQRRVAFTCNYIGMNLGFCLGYLLSGISSLTDAYPSLFLTIGILVLNSFIFTYLFIKDNQVTRDNLSASKQVLIFTGIILALVTIISLLLHYCEMLQNSLLILALTLFISVFFWGRQKIEPNQLIKYKQFAIFAGIMVVFWSIYMLSPTLIMQLIQNNTDRVIWGYTLAPEWFGNISTLTILIFAPILMLFITKNKAADSTNKYFSIGFVLSALALGILLSGMCCLNSGGQIPLISMVGYLFFRALSEIAIAPISFSLVGELIPADLRGIMTGVWSMTLGMGCLFASYIAKTFLMPHVNAGAFKFTKFIFLENSIILTIMGLLSLAILLKQLKILKMRQSL